MNRTSRFLYSALIAASGIDCIAQNLVPNPSFDVQTDCPDVSEIELAPPWYAPTNGTPDLFQAGCPTQNVPGHTGPGSAGVYVHGEGSFANYREYVQAQLTSPLVAGQGYCVSIWVRRANFRYATDRFGVLLTTSAVSLTNTNVLPFTPQVENIPGNVLDANGWEQISGGFFAEGGEQYITIGSFSGPANTTVTVANESSTSNVAFYAFDDVVVTPCAVGMGERSLSSFNVFPQPASERLSVQLPEGVVLQNAQLFDSRGSLVRNYASNGAGGLVDLDVNGLPSGLWHLLIRTDQGTASRTVMIAH